MLLGILRSEHGSEGKALTAMGIVRDSDQISIRVIADGMDARHLTTADIIHTQQFRVCRLLCPSLLAVQTLYDLFCQRDGCA